MCIKHDHSKVLLAVKAVLLGKMEVLEMTSTIPTFADSAYKALTVAAVHALAYSKKDRNSCFLIFKTAENTPSFLFGHHWMTAQVIGKEMMPFHVANTNMPLGFVVVRGQCVAFEYETTVRNSSCTTDLDFETVVEAIVNIITSVR